MKGGMIREAGVAEDAVPVFWRRLLVVVVWIVCSKLLTTHYYVGGKGRARMDKRTAGEE